MTTLKAAVRAAIDIERSLGVVVPITSLTTTTVVASALARGEPSSKYVQWYMARRDTATAADRVRQITNFAGSTGTLTHAGTNYGDTTATSEVVEVTQFSPEEIDRAAQKALGETRRKHIDIIPAHGGAVYPLDNYSWITKRGDVMRVLYGGQDLARNATFNGWNVISSAGAFEPDNWTKSGSGSTWTRSTSDPRFGPYALSVTRSGTNVTVEQYLGGGAANRSLLGDGAYSLASEGETLTCLVCATGTTASSLKAFINDGGTTTESSFHAAGGYEELTVSRTLPTTATQVSFGFSLAVDATFVVHRVSIFKVSSVGNAQKQALWDWRDTLFGWDDVPPAIRPNYRLGRGQAYQVESLRAYPELDATRLRGGTADADESDIPVDLWAYGILANLFESQSDERWKENARRYRFEFDRMKAQYLGDTRPPKYAPRSFGRMPRRA